MDIIKGREVLLPSGAKLYVNQAPYAEVDEFMGALLESIKGLPADTDNDELLKIVSQSAASQVFRNPPFKAAMWRCLAYCLYLPKDGVAPMKVQPSLFDGAGNRGDLPEVFYACAEDNTGSFWKGLYGMSKRLAVLIKSAHTQP